MKRTKLILMAGIVLLAASCTKSDSFINELENQAGTQSPIIGPRICASQDVLNQQLKADPSLAARMQAIENVTADYARNPQAYRLLANGMIEIPVVINVLYNTPEGNISDARIQSQIDVLNADFSATNSDYGNIPASFTTVSSGDIGVRFVLDQVVRKVTSKTCWNTDDAMKKRGRGGIAPTSPNSKLNFWVCNMSGGILGYAQFPGGTSSTDGVVIDDNAFGVTTNYAPYNKGRTATHEVGHWLNLRHIWGDSYCGSDLVGDTPLHNTYNFGCPAPGVTSSCSGTPIMMTMNYMDYTDDIGMYMFSTGQKTRMNATFASGGGRTGFAQP